MQFKTHSRIGDNMKMKIIKWIIGVFLLSSCMTLPHSKEYNYFVECNVVIVKKRFIPGVQNPDQFLLLLKDTDGYHAVRTTESYFDKKKVGDTIKTMLMFKPW